MKNLTLHSTTYCLLIILSAVFISSCDKPVPEGTLFSENVKYLFYDSQIESLKRAGKKVHESDIALFRKAIDLLEEKHEGSQNILWEVLGPPVLEEEDLESGDCEPSETVVIDPQSNGSDRKNERGCVKENINLLSVYTKPDKIDSKVIFTDEIGNPIGKVDFSSSTKYKNNISGYPIKWTAAPKLGDLFYVIIIENIEKKSNRYSYPYRIIGNKP